MEIITTVCVGICTLAVVMALIYGAVMSWNEKKRLVAVVFCVSALVLSVSYGIVVTRLVCGI